MKKTSLILLSLILSLSLILIGCNRNKEFTDRETADGIATEAIDREEETVNSPHVEDSSENTEADSESESETEEASSYESEESSEEATASREETKKNETEAYKNEETEAKVPEVTTADTAGIDLGFDTESSNAESKNDGADSSEPAIPAVPLSYTIIEGGTYSLSGTVTDQMITINAPSAEVTVILDGATVRNSKGPALYVRAASKVTLTLAKGTINTFSDGASYSITDSGSKLDAAIFSKADLTINGSGTLHVNGNCKHGLVSKDDLIISSGILNVNSKNIGINGKDCVKINSGSITVNAGTSGITSDNNTEATKGFISLYGGSIRITAGNDGIVAQNILNIENVSLNVKSGGGSASTSNLAGSFKGLKAGSDIYIKGGYFNIDSKDDSIHCNGTVTISGGSYTLSTADDAIHSDTDLAVSGSSTSLTIAKSNEGIEAKNLVISGGNVTVCTSGNGLDANGSLSVTGGNIRISTAGGKDSCIFKYDSAGTISGGSLFGTGTHSKEQGFSVSSQGTIKLEATGGTNETVTVKDSEGALVFSVVSQNDFSFIIISSPEIIKGNVFEVTVGSNVWEVTAE